MTTRSKARKASAAPTTPTEPVVQQMKPETRVRKKITETEAQKENGSTKPPKGTSKTKNRTARKAQAKEINCTCSRGDDGSPMVRCGLCQIWYHFTCVDLSEPDAEDISVFVCPTCTESTGRRSVMNWEGPSAFDDLTDGEPTASAQPPAKRSKHLPEPKSASEESEEDPSSDDEYVAEEAHSKRHPKQHPSVSSESDTDVDENGRPRRRRIHRISDSPTPSTLKRKTVSATATQPPPPKKRKASSVIATDDPTRKYCLGKLEEIFRDVFPRYPHVTVLHQDGNLGEQAAVKLAEKKPDELSDEEKAQILERANQFAVQLEQCIYELYSEPDKQGEPHAGGKYKDRFRMLQFNLSKTDRVVIHRRIASGNISPKEISTMSSTDLADEETKQHIKIAEQEALEHSILQKSTVPRAKITHKGLQDIEDINGELVSLREREREREREQEEEERRDRERMARVRAAQTPQRQRTASMSVPPESPVVPQQSPTWGAPPPVPAHAIASPAEESPSPASARSTANPIFASELTASEPELNLDDIINIEEETTTHDVTTVATEPSVSPSPPASDAQVPDVIDRTPSAVSPPVAAAVTTGISPFAAKPPTQSFDLNSLWSGPSAGPASTSPPTQPSPKSPRLTVQEHKDVIMEPMTVRGAEDQDFDMFLEEKEEKETIPPPVPVQPAFEDLPQVWSGKISMPLESAVQETAVVARQLGGRPIEDTSLLWKTLFPTEVLRIDGRVPTPNSCSFLLQTRLNPSKELIAVAFSSVDSANTQYFKAISDFLIGKNRHGLIFPWGQRPKDHCPGRELYIVPLRATDQLPECIELLDSLKLPKERTNDYLIGIWVLYKGRLAPPPPQSLPLPVQAPPLPPLTANIASTIFGNPSSIPSTSGLDTSALAKEVATLTPDQIQNVLRTLAATSQIALPPQAPQMQPQAPASLHPMPPLAMHPQQSQGWHGQPPGPYPPYQGSMAAQLPGPHRPGGVPPTAPLFERHDQRDFSMPPGAPSQGHDRSDRGDKSGRGRGPRGRGRGREGGSSPRRPVDSGWPQRKTLGDVRGGPPSPTRRW